MPVDYEYLSFSSVRIPCQRCNDENIKFLIMKELKTCKDCDQSLCSPCFQGHERQCHYDHLPVDVKEKLKIEGEKARAEMRMSKEVSENPGENCCNCGYKRHRSGCVWDIYAPNKPCKVCGNDFCAFCRVGMIKKTLTCKNGISGFFKRFAPAPVSQPFVDTDSHEEVICTFCKHESDVDKSQGVSGSIKVKCNGCVHMTSRKEDPWPWTKDPRDIDIPLYTGGTSFCYQDYNSKPVVEPHAQQAPNSNSPE